MKIIAQQKIKTKFYLSLFLILILGSITFGTVMAEKFIKTSPVQGSGVYKTVVVDAGHGGVDGGTQSADGTLEKDLNLSIALKVNECLKAFGIKTVMTRTEDLSIHSPNADTIRAKKISDIKNRLEIINKTDDCVFVSIHQNYFSQPKYYGAQVFYSPNNPQSATLAECVRASVCDNLQPDNDRELKQSGTEIYLLYHSSVPSVMVECGFLSNEAEANKLKDEDYQNKLAYFIALGIADYLNSTEVV